MPGLRFLAGLLALGATAASGVQVLGPVTNLPIVNKNLAPDGFMRPTVLAGGTFPGPLITGLPNSSFSINVQDQLTDSSMHKSTSIHFHGIFQHGTNWADGPAFVNQCPIAPGNSFQYNFNANGQAGTYWYHSHYSTQYCDGLRGPLVIYDPNDPYKSMYDVDNATTVITLGDWYHNVSSKQIVPPPPHPDAILINGMGRALANPTNTPLFVLNVLKGSRYRLRLVSISCDPAFMFSIDGHSFTVIEADGVNHKAVPVDSLQIFAGQRYSVIMQANQKVGNYWMRALPNNPANANFNGGTNSAILRYYGAPAVDPTTSSTLIKTLVETQLIPLINPQAPGSPDVNAPDVVKINMVMNLTNNLFTMNGASWPSSVPNNVPVLLQILNGAPPSALLPAASIYTLPSNKTIQISFPADLVADSGPHPMHLHGHTFSVIRSVGQTGYNFQNPPRRDVVNTGGIGDNVTIRFVTDNPGPWFLHCHIDWHLDKGFAVVMVEDQGDVKATEQPSQAWQSLCSTWNSLSPSDQ